MALQTRDDIFELIAEEKERTESADTVEAGISFVTEQLKKFSHLPSMQGVRVIDYYRWKPKELREREAEEREQELNAKNTTASDFLQAAYDFNPSATGSHSKDTKLVQLTITGCVPVIPIGKIYGATPVWLTVVKNPLLPSKIKARYYTNLPMASTDAGAISYADGHPSEADAEDSAYGNPKEVLSRFWPLGYISYKHSDGRFERTGHVLVMDMEPDRDHHPWIVLADQWADINEDGDDGLGFFHAPSRVRLDAPNVHGIFPGDTRRTPVAKLIGQGNTYTSGRPLLKQLGPDLHIGLWRKGGMRWYERTTKFKTFHPDLARIMAWHWDASTEEEVCYAEDGQEYSRYDTITGKFSTPNAHAVSLEGSIAMFGEVIRQALLPPSQTSGFVPLHARVDRDTLRRAPHIHAGSGF